jgi:O-antigen ligase
VLLSAAVLFDGQDVSGPSIPFTSRVPMFVGLGGIHLEGADLLLIVVAFIYFARSGQTARPRWRPRSHVSAAILVLLGAALLAIVIGRGHGGQSQVGFMEARPYVYLAATYFLTSVLITNRSALRALLWGFVGTVGFKALQGLYVWYHHRHDTPKPESFIGHEASYFFVIYLVLVLALWLFNQPGRLRTVATRLLPLVLACNMVNDRRAAWLMMAGALLTFGVIVYHSLPGRRHIVGRAVVIILLFSAVYLPVFWNRADTLAQPARAVASQVHPSARDASSDVYRVQEDGNLELNIKQFGLLGKGFGVKIDYALPIIDISSIDPLIAYIPHNDVLDVLMRMGLLGGIAMWSLIGTGILAGCRLAKSLDREVAMIGAVLASALVAYALMGSIDQGFFWYRIAFVTGSLLGLAEAARRMQGRQVAKAR